MLFATKSANSRYQALMSLTKQNLGHCCHKGSQKQLLAYAFALSAAKRQVGKVVSDFCWDCAIEAPSVRIKLIRAPPKLWRPAKSQMIWGASFGIMLTVHLLPSAREH